MKRITRLISAMLLCFTLMTFMCPAAFASAPTTPADMELTVTAPSTSVILGSSFTVTVTVTNKSASYNLDFIAFTLKYDRSILNYTANSANAGTDHTGLAVVDDANGLLVQYIADGTAAKKAVDKNGKMEIRFTFTPARTSTDPVSITFDSVRAFSRSNLSNSSVTEGNLLHTFTCTTPYNSLAMSFRSKSSNANLSSLSVKVDNVEVPISPAFSANVPMYTFSATEPVGAVTITCTCQDTNATYKQTQNGLEYKITVTAEDGTTKDYTVTLKSVPTTTTTTTSTTATTTTTTVPTTTTTTAPTTTTQSMPDTTQPTGGSVSDSTVAPGTDKSDGLLASVNISILGLIGLVAGEIGLFMLAFLSGYMTHKNASRPPKISLEDLVAAQAQAEQESYEDEMAQNEIRESAAMVSDMMNEPFTPQFSPQVSFGSDPMGMGAGYDMGVQPGMDGMDMQAGFDMNAQNGMAGMDGMGMQPGFDMNAQNGMAGMDGMGMQPGFDMNAQNGMAGMDGMGMLPGFDMNAQNGMGTPPGYGM